MQRRIEGMRKKLIQTASNYGLNNKRTIKISQELDSLLILIQKKR
ncbi:aspartyl-phosphate phosphatase Spo0E family protein [Bacillus sp. CH30_1T]|nr:aspartyl-phosphate phosphatase Spo0E family protein [Bacillus sp. CH30_1T]